MLAEKGPPPFGATGRIGTAGIVSGDSWLWGKR